MDAHSVYRGTSGNQLLIQDDSSQYTFIGVLGSRLVVQNRCSEEIVFKNASNIESFIVSTNTPDFECQEPEEDGG